MRRIIIYFSFVSVLALAASKALMAQGNPNPNPSLDAYIQSEMTAERFPGVSTVIVKDGKIVWMKSYGFADIQNNIPVRDTTVFLLASISKLFVGTAIMQLMENNQLNLDDNINQHLPFPIQIPGFPNAPITFRQLMTHTSSIQDNYTFMDTYYNSPDPSISLSECMLRYFSTSGEDYSTSNFLNNSPGTVYEYSNIATALNGYLVQLISGLPFNEYCSNEIFDKLCMNKTAWYMADFDSSHVARPYSYFGGNYVPYAHYGFADYPSGQLRSNVMDMANFMIAFLNNGTFENNSILQSSSVNAMLSVKFPNLENTQGLNWYREELFHDNGTTWLWGHNGGESGSSTDLYIDPVNKIGICVLTNGEGDALYICDELYNYALTLSPSTGYSPNCLTANIPFLGNLPAKTIVKYVDILGRETPFKTNTPLIKIYSDGSTEKIFVFE